MLSLLRLDLRRKILNFSVSEQQDVPPPTPYYRWCHSALGLSQGGLWKKLEVGSDGRALHAPQTFNFPPSAGVLRIQPRVPDNFSVLSENFSVGHDPRGGDGHISDDR